MDARKAVEKAAAAVEAAEAEVTRTRDERDAALCDAAASGAPKARIARAAEMSRAQVIGIIGSTLSGEMVLKGRSPFADGVWG